MLITKEHLSAIMPRLAGRKHGHTLAIWTDALNEAAARFEISRNADRLAAWLAQLAHESAELTRGREVTHYKTVTRVRQVFARTRRWPVELIEPLLGNPPAFANAIYAGLLGNGNEASGDGWAYRGGGPIGLTGRAQYRECGRGIGVPLEVQPELIEQPTVGALAAAWFWHRRKLNELVDRLEGEAETRAVTLAINGGYNGLSDRLHYARLAERAFGLRGLDAVD